MNLRINIREILRQSYGLGMSNPEVARAVCVAPNTVRYYRVRAKELGFDYSRLGEYDDKELHEYFKKRSARLLGKVMPDWAKVFEAIEHSGETLTEQWEKYISEAPGAAYSYSQFTHYYRKWKRKHTLSMRLAHQPGESAFVDFAGKKRGMRITWQNRSTGKQHEVELFVSCLGASDLIFVYATASQKVPDWIEANIRMLEYFGGVPRRIVCDNLKAAVIRPGRFPILNPAYVDFEQHYQTTITPARPNSPKDKAKVENDVKLVRRWLVPILARMTFFSIEEINAAILKLLGRINDRPLTVVEGTRRSRFETLERPALNPLPAIRHEYAEWTARQKVPSNYMVRVKDHFYSVPYTLVGEPVQARVTPRTVELVLNGRRVASHVRDDAPGEASILPEHRSPAHRYFTEATQENLLAWAKTVGPHTFGLCEQVYGNHSHPQPAINFCLALQRYVESGTPVESLEAAAQYAKERGICSMDRFRSVIKRQEKGQLAVSVHPQMKIPVHGNLRGETYYR